MNKAAPVVLITSLILNATLVILLVVGAAKSRPATITAISKPAAAARAGAPVLDDSVWPSLNSPDLPLLVNRLREAGFPPEMVRAVVSARLQDGYMAKRKAIDPDVDNRPFWKSSPMEVQTMTAMRQLGREMQKAMRDLIGDDADIQDPMSRARDARQFGFLPPEKATEARRIVREFNDLRSDVYMSFGGPITLTPADREKLASMDKQMRAELAKVMTPKEYEDYELRAGNSANNVRYQLAAFDPSETEFRAVFQLQRAFDDRFAPMYGQPSQEEMRLRSEAQRQLNDQIKAALGPARAKDYERATDYEYRTTSQLVARLELPPETTAKAWDIRDDIQRRANTIRVDSSLNPTQRNEQLAALQKEGIERMTPIFGGARGVEAYRQYGGQWLENLVPRQRPAPASAPAR